MAIRYHKFGRPSGSNTANEVQQVAPGSYFGILQIMQGALTVRPKRLYLVYGSVENLAIRWGLYGHILLIDQAL